MKLIDEFRRGWQGTSPPALLFSVGFSVFCLALATAVRWLLSLSLALVFHELATNAAKYGAFSSARGLLQVSWSISDDRLNITWDETEGPAVEAVGKAGFGTRMLKSALTAFEGRTEIAFLKTGVHCTMQCRIPPSETS